VGNGFVGKATSQLACNDIIVYTYDIVPSLSSIQFKDLNRMDVVFICLPTPMQPDGSCDTSAINTTITLLKSIGCQIIVVRSTVPPGYCDKRNVYFMPEFLTEASWNTDFTNSVCWFFGLPSTQPITNTPDIHNPFRKLATRLIDTAYRATRIKSNIVLFVDASTVEMLKLVKNTYLACKVGFFNEIYDLCRAINTNNTHTSKIDFDLLVSLMQTDYRCGSTHMQVPGPDGKRGYGGTCFPKDIASLHTLFNLSQVPTYHISAAIDRNYNKDKRNPYEPNNAISTISTSRNCNTRAICNMDHNIVIMIGCDDTTILTNMLDDPNNYVIWVNNQHTSPDITHSNFTIYSGKAHHKLLFPKINTIYYKTTTPLCKRSITEIYEVLRLQRRHERSTLYFNVPSWANPIIYEQLTVHPNELVFRVV
jgi:UDPglucose 6-dehydrogenase